MSACDVAAHDAVQHCQIRLLVHDVLLIIRDDEEWKRGGVCDARLEAEFPSPRRIALGWNDLEVCTVSRVAVA